jgi:hypothetical protein
MNMPVDAFLTALYTMVDDWYQAEGRALLRGKPGVPPEFSDSEVMTLALAQHWCGFAEERDWLRFVEQNYRPLFPKLVDQSQFNRRVRNLWRLLEALRQALVRDLDVTHVPHRLIDGTPIHVRHWRRYGRGHLLLEQAALGYCAAKKEPFYGYRLVLLPTRDGLITDWLLIPANADERDAALELLRPFHSLRVYGDKGFLDQERQAHLAAHGDVQLLTPKRANQHQQNPPEWDAVLNRVRRLIETTLKPRARTRWGVVTRIIAKLTAMTIAAWANVRQGYSPLRLAEFSF